MGNPSLVPYGYSVEPDRTRTLLSSTERDASRSPLGVSTCALPKGQVPTKEDEDESSIGMRSDWQWKSLKNNSRNEQSEPCQFRSHVHMSWEPHWPWPEHALGHSAWAMPKDANAAADARRDPRENLIAKVLTESEKSPVSCFTALAFKINY